MLRVYRRIGLRPSSSGASSTHAIRRLALFVFSLIAVVLTWQAYKALHPVLMLTVLDVGQGDCLFVRAPNGRCMLVDGGSLSFGSEGGRWVAQDRILPFLYQQGVGRIDVMVLTHPDEDHVNALPWVISELEVGAVLEPDTDYPAPSYRTFKEALIRRGVRPMRAERGQRINLDPQHGVVGEVLAPLNPRLENTANDLNNNSVVILLRYGRWRILLPADIESEAQRRLLEEGTNLRAQILKVPHHGSETALDEEFLQAVHPQVAIISVGKYNPFGHPCGKTLLKLQGERVRIYRTDEDGAIIIRLSSNRCSVTTWGRRV